MSDLNAYWVAVVASLFFTFGILWFEYKCRSKTLTKGHALLAFIVCWIPFINFVYAVISGILVTCIVYEEYLSEPFFK